MRAQRCRRDCAAPPARTHGGFARCRERLHGTGPALRAQVFFEMVILGNFEE
jgi:hypothetical protein